jgi:hypothetical protein
MSGWNLPVLIDHTVLKPDATKVEVLRLCKEAKANGFTVIFVPPCYLDEAAPAFVSAFPSGFRWEDTAQRPRWPKQSKQWNGVQQCWTWC